MFVNSLVLFKNVKITRDYSTVHDMTPTQWFEYLMNVNNVQSGDPSPPVEVYRNLINYYRLPDTIRIEANYDDIREATYGCLTGANEPGMQKSFDHLFFWVDSVRLVRQHVVADEVDTKVLDTVELTVSLDLWSNKFTECELYDSFVVRRHEERWYRDHSDPDDPDAWVYHPRYFPNAADDVGGAYEQDGNPQDLTEPLDISSEVPGFTEKLDLRFIVVSALDNNGQLKIIIGGSVVGSLGREYPIYTDYSNGYKLFSLDEVLSGAAFSAAGLTASYIQSIAVTPYIEAIRGSIHGAFAGGVVYLYINDTYIPFSQSFEEGHSGVVAYIKTKNEVWRMASGLYSFHQEDIDPKVPEFVYDGNNPLLVTYNDKNEPMMFRSPARIRRVTSGMGGAIVEVPDIEAFQETFTCQNLFEIDQLITVVFGGSNIERANALGNIGTVTGASLPIYSSAWKEYQAIQKAGDDISYNAKQVQAVVSGVTGMLGGAAAGALATGNPAGAVAGGAGGVVGGVVNVWANSENLRAKRETIRNSPCTVKSGGSGLGAYIKDYIDIHYQVMKLEQISLNKLRTQYYYYGYNVNMVVPGTVKTHYRKYFDYIETRGAQIRGNVNAEEARQIAGCFDRGVRIYHGYPGYQQIGAGMSLENPERAFLE